MRSIRRYFAVERINISGIEKNSSIVFKYAGYFSGWGEDVS